MRLINEDDVLEIIERVTNEAVEKKQPKHLIQPRIIAEIAGLPTIKAESVKHGRWVKSDTQKHVEITYECSECQHEVVGEYEKTPFCGGCGVRIDGDTDNNVRNLTDEETAIYESWIESEAKDTDLNIMGGESE